MILYKIFDLILELYYYIDSGIYFIKNNEYTKPIYNFIINSYENIKNMLNINLIKNKKYDYEIIHNKSRFNIDNLPKYIVMTDGFVFFSNNFDIEEIEKHEKIEVFEYIEKYNKYVVYNTIESLLNRENILNKLNNDYENNQSNNNINVLSCELMYGLDYKEILNIDIRNIMDKMIINGNKISVKSLIRLVDILINDTREKLKIAEYIGIKYVLSNLDINEVFINVNEKLDKVMLEFDLNKSNENIVLNIDCKDD